MFKYQTACLWVLSYKFANLEVNQKNDSQDTQAYCTLRQTDENFLL